VPAEFQFHGFSEEEFRQLAQEARGAINLAIKYMAEEVWGNIKKEAPVDHGRLAGSFELQRMGELQWKIFTNVEYALAVQTGSGIHGPEGKLIEIRPKNKKALFWPGAQHPVKKVLHPGQKPNPYATRAMDKASTRTAEFAQRAINETFGGAA